MRLEATLFWAVLLTLRVSGGYAADLTREEVQAALSTAPSGHGVNFAGRSFAGLDLHELDFTGADLSVPICGCRSTRRQTRRS